MKKLLTALRSSRRWRRFAGDRARRSAQELIVRAGAEEHEQPVLRPGPRRLQEGRGGIRRQVRVPVYRPRRAWRRRRAGADRAGPDRQEGRRHRRVARPTPPPWRKALQAAKAAGIPVLTWDSDLLPKDKDLRVAYVGTTTTTSASTSPSSRRRSSRRAARSASSRAAPRRPTTTSACRASATRSAGKTGATAPGDRLTGQNGWTEVDGCPLYTNDDFPLSVQQMEDILGKYPDLDAFIPTGGFPQFVPEAYAQGRGRSTRTRIDSGALALVVADTLPVQMDLMKEGLSLGQVGQRPFEMGYKTMCFLKDIKDGKAPPGRPDLHRPRRLHAGDRRHLHREVTNWREAGIRLPTSRTAGRDALTRMGRDIEPQFTARRRRPPMLPIAGLRARLPLPGRVPIGILPPCDALTEAISGRGDDVQYGLQRPEFALEDRSQRPGTPRCRTFEDRTYQ